MSEPFLAEIKLVGFNFPPRGWAHCDGQILPINQNQSLYSLLGTTYGGDGRTTFALPDLRGRTPVHRGSSSSPGSTFLNLGAKSGRERVQLTTAQIPAHNHRIKIAAATGHAAPQIGDFLATSKNELRYSDDTESSPATMRAETLANTGSSQSHNNMQPFLALNYVIALQGLFPSRN